MKPRREKNKQGREKSPTTAIERISGSDARGRPMAHRKNRRGQKSQLRKDRQGQKSLTRRGNPTRGRHFYYEKVVKDVPLHKRPLTLFQLCLRGGTLLSELPF